MRESFYPKLKLPLAILIIGGSLLSGLVGVLAGSGVEPPRPWLPMAALTTSAMITFLLAGVAYGWRRVLPITALIVVYGWTVEYLGETRGLIYSSFDYTEALGYQIAGSVPWTIGLAWAMLIWGGVGWLRALGCRGWRLVLGSGLLVTAFDLVLDPGAVHSGYWSWPSGGFWYGVPWVNFAGWLLVATVGSWLVVRLLGDSSASRWPTYWLMAGNALVLAHWTAFAATVGYWWAAGVGLALLSAGWITTWHLTRHTVPAEAGTWG
jgi:putative membrane protein